MLGTRGPLFVVAGFGRTSSGDRDLVGRRSRRSVSQVREVARRSGNYTFRGAGQETMTLVMDHLHSWQFAQAGSALIQLPGTVIGQCGPLDPRVVLARTCFLQIWR